MIPLYPLFAGKRLVGNHYFYLSLYGFWENILYLEKGCAVMHDGHYIIYLSVFLAIKYIMPTW